MICPALEHCCGELEPADVLNQLLAGSFYLFVIYDGHKICGASTCQIVQYNRKRAIRVVTLSGECFPQWRQQMLDVLKDWQKKAGADYIEAYVRPGFRPQLEGLGFKYIYAGMVYGA